MTLHDIAPRLAAARDGYNAAVAAAEARRAFIVAQRLRVEKLVAHRELQLARAQRTGNGSYIRKRAGKLDAARHALDSLERP